MTPFDETVVEETPSNFVQQHITSFSPGSVIDVEMSEEVLEGNDVTCPPHDVLPPLSSPTSFKG
jgi:hypothetical protein